MGMNSRERVLLALDHKEPDRIPIDLGATIVSSITNSAYLSLKSYLNIPKQGKTNSGIPREEIQMLDYVQQLPYLDDTLLDRFGVDFRMVQLPAATAPGLNIFEEGNYYAFTDRWGSKLHMPKESGYYFDWVDFPIKEPSLEALDQYNWPSPDPQEYIQQLGKQAKSLYENTDFALVGSAVIGGGIFEQPARTMGMENFLASLIEAPKFADQLMERITDIYIESCNQYLDSVGGFIQVFTYWDDVNTQNGWMINPNTYRKMVKPKQRRLVEAIKRKTEAKLFFHGCGATFDLIPDLIELGFDILNPVQVSARGMDTKRLKQEYGKDITFWGGVDTQRILPFGSPAEVIEEAKRRINDLAPGGGFVFAAVHNIQPQVPPENIVALFDTALDYGIYHP
jgi:uroporphyrinogen decarboxylase